MSEHYKKIIEDYIIENINHCNDYSFEIFCKMVDDFLCNVNKKKLKLNYSKEYSIDEIFELANDIFNELGLIELINSEPIEYSLVKKDDTEMANRYKEIGICRTTSKFSKNEKNIIIFLDGTLSDVYEIVHETIHAIMCDYSIIKEQSLLEVLPYLSELYLSDYLQKNGVEESYINTKIRKEYIEKYLPNASWEAIYLTQVLEEGKINNFYKIDELVISFAQELIDKKNLYIHQTEKYLFGMMFASYIHQNIDISKFIELCTKIKNMDFKEFFEFINLSNAEGKIDESGYQKIFKSYERDYMHE